MRDASGGAVVSGWAHPSRPLGGDLAVLRALMAWLHSRRVAAIRRRMDRTDKALGRR
jgi:hypothetical protein